MRTPVKNASVPKYSNHTRTSTHDTGKENQFGFISSHAVVLIAIGVVLALFSPIAGIIPFIAGVVLLWYHGVSWARRNNQKTVRSW